jgi:hypothetical protein
VQLGSALIFGIARPIRSPFIKLLVERLTNPSILSSFAEGVMPSMTRLARDFLYILAPQGELLGGVGLRHIERMRSRSV